MGRCLVALVLLALGGPCAAHGRISAALRRTRQDPNAASDAAGDQISNSQGVKTYGAVKDTWERPPDDLGESGSAAARIAGVPTQSPIKSPWDIPGYFANMVWTTLTMNFMAVLIQLLISLLFLFILAWLYVYYKNDPVPTNEAERLAWARKADQQGFLRFSLFSCHQAPWWVICLACCCPSIRWADTMRMAGLFTFWAGFMLFACLILLNPYTASLTGLVLLCILTMKRQDLRKRFDMPFGGTTWLLDCCTYLCCACCAIVQEAQVMEEAFAVGHPVLTKPPRSYKLRPSMEDYAPTGSTR